MPKLSEAKVGDTVILKLVVEATSANLISLVDPTDHIIDSVCLATNRKCKEIISPPWEPKVGDTVFHIGWIDGYHKYAPSHPQGVTLLYIHRLDTNMPERHWAVVAYKSGIPKVVKFSDLRKEFSDVRKEFSDV